MKHVAIDHGFPIAGIRPHLLLTFRASLLPAVRLDDPLNEVMADDVGTVKGDETDVRIVTKTPRRVDET